MYPGIACSSPPKYVSLEEIMSAAKGMANMALVHEIAVDSNFEFEKVEPPENRLGYLLVKLMQVFPFHLS